MNALEHKLVEHLAEFTAFARKRVGDPELAADVVQDSLLKALKSGYPDGGIRDAKAWFYRILRRTIIDLYRRQDTRKRGAAALEAELAAAPTAEEERAVCGCLERLIPTLKPEYAALIRRLDLQNESPDAVAASLDVTRNNLNVRLHRARQQLKDRLETSCRMCAKHGCLDCTCDAPRKADDHETQPSQSR